MDCVNFTMRWEEETWKINGDEGAATTSMDMVIIRDWQKRTFPQRIWKITVKIFEK